MPVQYENAHLLQTKLCLHLHPTLSPTFPSLIPSLSLFPRMHLQALPQPIPQLSLTKLRQIIHTLLGQVDTLQVRHILRGRLADSLDNDSGVCFEDDSIVYDLVNGEGDEVVVFDYGAFVYCLSVRCT